MKPTTPNLMTAAEVADYLNVPLKTVRQWVHQRRIPNIKMNGTVRFNYIEINAWLAQSSRDVIVDAEGP